VIIIIQIQEEADKKEELGAEEDIETREYPKESHFGVLVFKKSRGHREGNPITSRVSFRRKDFERIPGELQRALSVVFA
jgi:hypothetical protein